MTNYYIEKEACQAAACAQHLKNEGNMMSRDVQNYAIHLAMFCLVLVMGIVSK